jgi:hypothetical protein
MKDNARSAAIQTTLDKLNTYTISISATSVPRASGASG